MAADEVADPESLTAVAYVSGTEVARGSMADPGWCMAQLISYASGAEPLGAGEIVASGTWGAGSGQDLGRFMEPGDMVDM